MEVEATFSSCSPGAINETPMQNKPSSEIPPSGSSIAAVDDHEAKPCFHCNICLSFATDPVITLCGHLYCWPCIYRWLHLDSASTSGGGGNGRSLCPVCKSPFSESSLVPLYGCGVNAKSHHQSHRIPDRPTDRRKLLASATNVAVDHPQQIYPSYNSGQGSSMRVMRSTAGVVLGEMAFGMAPRASTNYPDSFTRFYRSPEMVAGGSRGSRSRRRSMLELRAESWLHQLWVFLFCCAVLCLAFF